MDTDGNYVINPPREFLKVVLCVCVCVYVCVCVCNQTLITKP